MERLYAPWRMAYVDQPNSKRESGTGSGCVFCDKVQSTDDISNLIVHRGVHTFVILNLFPYNNGHLMVVPYAHYGNFQDLDQPAMVEMMQFAQIAQKALDFVFHPNGYNLGMNLGLVAGAGITDHIHLHIVPRWAGDTNFMPVLGETKVMPDSLESSCRKIRDAWTAVTADGKP